MEYFLLILVTTIGSLIQRVTGFGFAIFAMMFLPYFCFTYGEANALSGMLSLVSTLIISISLFKLVSWKNLIIPAAACAVTSYFAVMFMAGQKDTILRIMLGSFLILLSVYFMFFSSKIHIKPTWYGGLAAGSLSGILSGLFSMGGPPVVIYFMESEKDIKRYLATIQAYFLITNIINTAIKASAGFVTGNVLLLWCFGAVGMVAGIFIGNKVLCKLDACLIKKMVYGMMAVSGVINIVTSLV
jgi:uncharacterized membrane protein YfcA